MAKVSKGVLGKTITSLPLLALASAAWVVLLAGLAIAEHQGASGLGFPWFIWAFQGFVLFFCILHLIEVGAGFSLAHGATAALLAVVTVLTILMTDRFDDLRKNGVTGMLRRGFITAFAGFLALSVLNILLLIVLGTRHDPGTSSHKKDDIHSQRQAAAPISTQYGTAPAATGTNPGYGGGATMV